MKHIDETKIELYLLNSPTLADERSGIEAHLAGCKGCKELYDNIASFYTDVQNDLASSENLPMPRPAEIPARRLYPLEQKYQNLSPSRRFAVTVPLRMARWMVHHPYAAGGVTLMFSSLLIVGMINMFKPTEPRDMNPTHADFAGEMMLVKNKYGETIDEVKLDAQTVAVNNERISSGIPIPTVVFCDVDGDGYNEVIWGYKPMSEEFSPALVYCKSIAQERILWTDTLRRKLVFPEKPEVQGQILGCSQIIVGDYDADGSPEVYCLTNHVGYFSMLLIKLDGRSGKEISYYVNVGSISKMKPIDMDNDGVKELILVGINNSLENACVIIIDPRFISGHSPTEGNYRLDGSSIGLERTYIRIPKTMLAEVFTGRVRWNSANEIRVNEIEKSFTVGIQDLYAQGTGYTANYYLSFDRKLEANLENTQDNFDALAKKLRGEHRIPFIPDSTYWNNFVKKIQYWDGYTWQNYPTLNKLYLEAVKKLKLPS